MANFPIPKGYQRMGAFPIDASSQFTSLVELEAYALSNGTAYVGQVCSVVEGGVVTVCKINADKSVSSIEGGSTNFGEY